MEKPHLVLMVWI